MKPIEALMRAKGITYREIAAVSGLSTRTIRKAIVAPADCHYRSLCRIADVFGVTVADLMDALEWE